MKTPLFLLSLFASCGLLAQAPDIGAYPSTTWASTNLLINRALEAGTVGQAIGYTALGEVGVVSLGSGGGGADTNAVWNLATTNDLVNTVVPSGRAWVGNQLYNLEATGVERSIVLTNFAYFPSTFWSTNGCISSIITTEGFYHVIFSSEISSCFNLSEVGYLNASTVIGQRYYVRFDGYRYAGDATRPYITNAISQSNVQWHENPGALTIVPQRASYSFTATSTSDFKIGLALDIAGTFDVRFEDIGWATETESPTPSGSFPSVAQPGFIWTPIADAMLDAISDGQTYGRKDGAWVAVTGGAAQTTNQVNVTSAGYQFAPTADVLWITDIYASSTIDFTGQPAILPGTDGQYLQIFNDTTATIRWPRNTNPTLTNSRVHSPSSLFPLLPGYYGYFRYRLSEVVNETPGIWDAFGTWPILFENLEVNILPAPWEPPDDEGNQVLRDDVQDALIDALLPRLLQRLAVQQPAVLPVRGTGRRGGAPGTRGNPIDWPADPEPAPDSAGKYNINIRINDR